jgi:hypothetical protein
MPSQVQIKLESKVQIVEELKKQRIYCKFLSMSEWKRLIKFNLKGASHGDNLI